MSPTKSQVNSWNSSDFLSGLVGVVWGNFIRVNPFWTRYSFESYSIISCHSSVLMVIVTQISVQKQGMLKLSSCWCICAGNLEYSSEFWSGIIIFIHIIQYHMMFTSDNRIKNSRNLKWNYIIFYYFILFYFIYYFIFCILTIHQLNLKYYQVK